MRNFINDQLTHAFESHPDRVAFATSEVSYTYSQLAHLVPRIATKLQAEGISKGSRVGISQGSAIDYLLSWSLLWLGVPGCSLPKEIGLAKGDFGIDWLLSNAPAAEFEGDLNPADKSLNVVVDRLWLMEAEAISEPIAAPDLDDAAIARLSMTSGSTGEPKCVSFSFEFVATKAFDESIASKHQVRGSFFGPTIWVGFNRLLASFAAGATIHILPVNSPESLAKSVDLGLEEISGSPAQYVTLLQTLGSLAARFWSLKLIRVSGGLLTKKLKESLFEAFGCDIEVRYSSTETGNVASAVINPSSPDYFVGQLASTAIVEIVDDAGNKLVFGQRGLVRIKKPAMVTEYLSRSGQLSPALSSDWFYPGDEGSVNSEGELFIYGRAGQVKNFGGVKIDLSKVEQFFEAEPGVSGCAALSGFTDALGVERIVIALEVGSDFDRPSTVEKAEKQTFFSSVLDLVELTSFPRSEMGKIQKAALAEQIRNIQG